LQPNQKRKKMKKTVITFGLIAGVIVTALMYITIPFTHESKDFENGEVLGYLSMLIAMSMIFFAIKAYRDKHLGGTIKFGKGFLVGLYITLIAGVVYGIGWEVYYQNWGGNFMEEYAAFYAEKMKASGATEAAIQAEMDNFKNMSELYKNPFVRFAWTLFEIVPVGIVVSLLCAAILRKKQASPAV
jgi:hypothetical protein